MEGETANPTKVTEPTATFAEIANNSDQVVSFVPTVSAPDLDCSLIISSTLRPCTSRGALSLSATRLRLPATNHPAEPAHLRRAAIPKAARPHPIGRVFGILAPA
jgi:hypothetical protein